MLSAQNTTLPTAPLSATAPALKATMIDGVWVDVPMILSREAGRLVERPADGSASLLEAALRARALAAYTRIFKTCSPEEQVSPSQSSSSGLTRGPSMEA